MKKDDILELEILDNGLNFEGISRYQDKVVFVPNAILKEKVSVKVLKDNKNFSIAKLEQIIKPSASRVEPFCSVYKRCGGCSAQHIDYNMQLIIKNNMVKSCLAKQNVKAKVINSTIGMGLPYYYRNKVQYPVRVDKNKNTVMGFYSKRSHDVVENNCCYIQERVIDMLAKKIYELILEQKIVGYDEVSNTGELRHLVIRRGYHTGQIMIIFVVNNKECINDKRFVKLIQDIYKLTDSIKGIFINVNNSKTNEIF